MAQIWVVDDGGSARPRRRQARAHGQKKRARKLGAVGGQPTRRVGVTYVQVLQRAEPCQVLLPCFYLPRGTAL